ncbi:MAG: alginate export family protein [Betaproteobacteria bacterium]|nr:alginate export family protein [Betaproteobacteria bacterium]
MKRLFASDLKSTNYTALLVGRILLAVPLLFPAGLAFSAEESAGSLADAITGGKLLLNLRPRYEHVEQDGKQFDANALTLRTLLGWQTGSYYGFGVTAQMIDVGRANDNYNDTKNGKTQFPTVADPDNTDINQVYLDYTGLSDTRLRLGKQSIKIDNVRFVGNVEFRQVMQVFTGATVENKSLPNTTLYGGHLERLKTIFGDQQEIKLEILHAAYEWAPGNNLIGYGYFHDSAKTASVTGFANNSNQIVGLRADGAYPLSDQIKLLYTAEYAKQNDYADGDSRIDADYTHAGVGLGWPAFYARLDYELLGSNNGVYAFQTPLGTNHLFQGWADLFLTTPKQGIRDSYLTVGGSVVKAKWSAEYHDFKSDFGSIHYGHELDFGVTYPLMKGLVGKVEYASFREDDVLAPATARKRDTDKLWLTFIYNFE